MTEQTGDTGQLSRAGRLPGARLVFAFQYLLGAVYLLGAGGVLLTAGVRTGDYAGMLDPRLGRFGDPKDLLPLVGPDSPWNPLAWVFGLSYSGSLFITPLAVFAVIAGLAYLSGIGLRSYLSVTSLRGHGRVFRHLAVGTAICLALAVFTVTPYGWQLQTWLLD
jgi:hypothetical protein